MVTENSSVLYKLPICIVTKICSYALNKNIPMNFSCSDVLKLRASCKLVGYLGTNNKWWEQICTWLNSNTCTFYCYKILEFLMSPEPPVLMNWGWCYPKSELNRKEHGKDILLRNNFNMFSRKLKPSVKVTLLRFIAIHTYRLNNNRTGVLFFKDLLYNCVAIGFSQPQLANTLSGLDDKQFFEIYHAFLQSISPGVE